MRRYTWSYNSQVVRLYILLYRPVSSYLTFSPLPLIGAVVLCYLNSALTNSFPLRNTMLCVARTFLFLPCGSQRQTDLLQFDAKIVHFLGIYLTAVSLDLFVALFSFLILMHFIELRAN